ncbi:MAG: YjjG family noncanonical pyrimidine nucleotidase [Flavobacteriaceae bacterium]
MLQLTEVQHLYFDLDHTLWDFEENSKRTFEKILKEHVFPFTLEEFIEVYSPYNHHYWKQYRENRITTAELRYKRLASSFTALAVEISDSQILEISEAYIQGLSTFTALFPGTIPLLKRLQKKYRLHIITNGFDVVQQKKINNSGLGSFFDTITTAEAVGFKKPRPEIFAAARGKRSVLPAQAIMIGDSLEADILGGLQDGMQAVHFNSHQEAEHSKCPIVYALVELEDLLLSETEKRIFTPK